MFETLPVLFYNFSVLLSLSLHADYSKVYKY